MTRTDVIQTLIDVYGLKSYLEIGTQQKKNNFDKVKCEYKLSVDPDSQSDADVHLTSDKFFETIGKKFDLIFIDGLHEEKQVLKDIENAILHLNENGYIVVHDCNPPNEIVQRVPRESKQWTGDVWKSWVRTKERSDLFMYVVATDWGCGVIQRGNQYPLHRVEDLTYDNLDKNRERWLGLISVDTFYAYHRGDF